MVEDEPVAESSKRAETYVEVAPSLKDIGTREKNQAEKVGFSIARLRLVLTEAESSGFERNPSKAP